jgi:hypothetical protein
MSAYIAENIEKTIDLYIGGEAYKATAKLKTRPLEQLRVSLVVVWISKPNETGENENKKVKIKKKVTILNNNGAVLNG